MIFTCSTHSISFVVRAGYGDECPECFRVSWPQGVAAYEQAKRRIVSDAARYTEFLQRVRALEEEYGFQV